MKPADGIPRPITASVAFAGLLVLGGLMVSPIPAQPAPYIWDQDGDRIDDRAETVHLLGYEFSFVGADTLAPQRIEVTRDGVGLIYGVYVVYDHVPTPNDLLSLRLLLVPVHHRYEAINAVRSTATFAQIQAVKELPGVERVEAVPVLHDLVRDGAGSMAVRDEGQRVFPTWAGAGGGEGAGVVIAILDTGVNDAPMGGYPGHESLAGRALGGAAFVSGDSTLDTGRDGSVNPADLGGTLTQSHGTHVAGIALGSGGPSLFARGIAPQAHLIDVKVLNDAGVGTGLPEALDWCIHNRDRDWGVPGFEGIDIINLSLSSPDSSDGNDVASRLAAKAVELGIVVVASAGNDGLDQHVPSPAAGDGVIAVGAFDAQRSPQDADDVFASFGNRGPRDSDGDTDALDELKPDLLAPGVAVLSADGDPNSDGGQYHRMSGTSMSAAFVSGAAACLLSSHPALSPTALAQVLRTTAWRGTAGLPAGPPGADPRWQAARGFGAVDLYAAMLELEQPNHSQVVRLLLESQPSGDIRAELRTQRELNTNAFVFERAPDQAGAPGAFVPYDAVAAQGGPTLDGAGNRTVYVRNWIVPEAERGQLYWHRVTWTEQGVPYASPARRLINPAGASAATLEITIVHNAYDQDVDAQVVTDPGNALESLSATQRAPVVLPLPGTSAAFASDWVTGESTGGNIEWTFRVEVGEDQANGWLPPSSASVWNLEVAEGGFLNRHGRVTGFKLIRHLPSGDQVHSGGPLPQPTFEGQTTHVTIPAGTVGVEPRPLKRGLRAGPNPVATGQGVRFTLPGRRSGEIRVFDLSGRQVGRAPLTFDGTASRAEWFTRDARGQDLPAGLYFARIPLGPTLRLAVVAR